MEALKRLRRVIPGLGTEVLSGTLEEKVGRAGLEAALEENSSLIFVGGFSVENEEITGFVAAEGEWLGPSVDGAELVG